MKSLNYIQKFEEKNPQIFTPEIIKWIIDEGFEIKHNDSYCSSLSNGNWEDKCFFKHGGYCYGDWPIHIYIFSYGIGVDIDYECGGNSSIYLWNFDEYSFEEAYDDMVDYVNSRRN